MAKTISCGILLYRKTYGFLEFFLVLPGGPYGNGALWGIPKGKKEDFDKTIEDAAIREFTEEVGVDINFNRTRLIDLGRVLQRRNKYVYCFAYEYDLGDNFKVKSNMTSFEYPERSGHIISVPEIAKGKYFSKQECQNIMIPAQYSAFVRDFNI